MKQHVLGTQDHAQFMASARVSPPRMATERSSRGGVHA
jgi:hypothetical protein